eukprot:TRINITY_DN67329_c11_g3_i1.p1 TRINITY_DN67329_c11_g3~~TRINITY_DN67329_c11_g3_i1.p1  ORF type:complete len:622 (+),score=49.35 TRINITY_DN67329_c11_g3_i1:40-1905(+)
MLPGHNPRKFNTQIQLGDPKPYYQHRGDGEAAPEPPKSVYYLAMVLYASFTEKSSIKGRIIGSIDGDAVSGFIWVLWHFLLIATLTVALQVGIIYNLTRAAFDGLDEIKACCTIGDVPLLHGIALLAIKSSGVALQRAEEGSKLSLWLMNFSNQSALTTRGLYSFCTFLTFVALAAAQTIGSVLIIRSESYLDLLIRLVTLLILLEADTIAFYLVPTSLVNFLTKTCGQLAPLRWNEHHALVKASQIRIFHTLVAIGASVGVLYSLKVRDAGTTVAERMGIWMAGLTAITALIFFITQFILRGEVLRHSGLEFTVEGYPPGLRPEALAECIQQGLRLQKPPESNVSRPTEHRVDTPAGITLQMRNARDFSKLRSFLAFGNTLSLVTTDTNPPVQFPLTLSFKLLIRLRVDGVPHWSDLGLIAERVKEVLGLPFGNDPDNIATVRARWDMDSVLISLYIRNPETFDEYLPADQTVFHILADAVEPGRTPSSDERQYSPIRISWVDRDEFTPLTVKPINFVHRPPGADTPLSAAFSSGLPAPPRLMMDAELQQPVFQQLVNNAPLFNYKPAPLAQGPYSSNGGYRGVDYGPTTNVDGVQIVGANVSPTYGAYYLPRTPTFSPL